MTKHLGKADTNKKRGTPAVPAAQGLQAEALGAPWYEPAAQGVQLDEEAAVA